MENGYFKFKLDSQIQTKIVNSGDYSFVFQVKMLLESVYTLQVNFFNWCLKLNTLRFTEKRKAEAITKLDKPFDPTIFNFTKIKDQEVFFFNFYFDSYKFYNEIYLFFRFYLIWLKMMMNKH